MTILCKTNDFGNRNIRWTHEKNLHLTLCFLGSIPVEHIPVIAGILTGVAAKSAPFALRFDMIAWGPPARPARMIWGNFFPDTAFPQLARDIARELESDITGVAGRNIRLVENRVIIPHVTLARFSDMPKSTQRTLPPLGGTPNRMTVSSFSLYESILRPAGATYDPLHVFAFKKQS